MAKEKLTEEQEVMKWLDRISESERFRDQYRRHYDWSIFIQAYKCRWEGILPDQIAPYNYLFSWAKTEVASLYLKDPHVEVNPIKRATVEQAKIRELLITDIIRRKKAKRELKKQLLDGLLVGHGWMKTGFEAEFDTILDAEGQQLQSIVDEDFFLYRVPWGQMTFNTDSVNVPFDSRWIAQEMWVPIEELKKKKGFKNVKELETQASFAKGAGLATTHADAQDGGHDRGSDSSPGEPRMDSGIKFVQIYEIWDLKGKKVHYVAPGVAKFIFQKPWPYSIMKGFPYSYFNANPVNDEPYGVPDPFTWWDQLIEEMKVDHTIDDHVKKGNRQIVISEDNEIIAESIKDYEEGNTGAILKFRFVTPDKLTTIPFMNVLPDVYPLRNIRKENILNTSGQSAVERGATEKTSTRTFRELALIDRGAKNRRSERMDSFEDTMEDAFSKISALQAEFADVPYYVRVTGKQPQEIQQAIQQRPSSNLQDTVTNVSRGELRGFSVTKEDLGSTGEEEFDVEIQAGSTVPMDRENKIQMLEIVAEKAIQGGAIPGGPLMGAIARMYFQEFDNPELGQALQEEQQMQQILKAEAKEKEETIMKIQAANAASEIQIKAEREATKNLESGIKQQDADTRAFDSGTKRADVAAKERIAKDNRSAKSAD